MTQDLEYYSSLLNQGYSEPQALLHTQSHFPEFNPPVSTPPVLNPSHEVKSENIVNEEVDSRSQYIPVSKSKIKKALLERMQLNQETRGELENLFKMFVL